MVLGGQDKWRKHPLLYNLARKPFPGLGNAVVIFTVYCIFDYAFSNYKIHERPHRTVTFDQESVGVAPVGEAHGKVYGAAHH